MTPLGHWLAASLYMVHDLSKLAASAAIGFCVRVHSVSLDNDLHCLVCAFTVPFASETRAAAAITYLFCKKSMLA